MATSPRSSEDATVVLWALPVILVIAVVVAGFVELSFMSMAPFAMMAAILVGYHLYARKR